MPPLTPWATSPISSHRSGSVIRGEWPLWRARRRSPSVCSGDDAANLRRAAAIHDIGMVGVPSGVWDAKEPWTLAQSERARTHPYLAERMFARVPALRPVVACAAQHHERLDGSGYPHGLSGSALSPTARILAAADVYHALREARPHRQALDADTAVAAMREEVQERPLDPAAVDAVLRAAGHRVSRARRAARWSHPPRGRGAACCSRVGCRTPISPHADDQPQDRVLAPRTHLRQAGVTTRTEAALLPCSMA